MESDLFDDVLLRVSQSTGVSIVQIRAILDLVRLYKRRSMKKGGI